MHKVFSLELFFFPPDDQSYNDKHDDHPDDNNKTNKYGDIAPWKDLKKIWAKIKEKKKEITIF